MGNIEDFAAQLAGEDFQKQLAAENPYFNVRQAPDLVGQQIIPLLAKSPGKYSTGQALALALGSGLFSGALTGMGDQYQNEKTTQYQNTINDLAFGKPVDQNALPPSIFRKAQDAVTVFRNRKALADQQAEEDLNRQVQKQIELQTNPEILNAEIKKARILESIRDGGTGGLNRSLSPEEVEGWGATLNLAPEEKKLLKSARDVGTILEAKRNNGEKVRPPTAQELTLISSNDSFRDRIKEIKKLVEKSDESNVLRAVKGGKLFSWFGDTESPAYKLYTALGTATQQFAKATLGSQISDFDVRTWKPAFEGLPLLDSKQAILGRLDDIARDLNRSKLNTLETLKKGLVNVDNFEPDKQQAMQALGVSGEDMVTIRNKRTGQTMQVPRSAIGG